MGGRGLTTRRWGILGGTFDPIHYAHLTAGEQVAESLGLAGVLFIPAARPVHKPAAIVTAAEHRVEMVRRAISDNEAFQLSEIELRRPAPSYSVETVAQLVEERRQEEFVFIVSAETAYELPAWRQPSRLLELSQIALVPRLGYSTPSAEWLREHFAGQQERFLFVETTPLGHSASDIRSRVAAGRSIRYLVPSAVEEYIREHGLYMADG